MSITGKLTPRYFTRTLAAGTEEMVSIYGRFLALLIITPGATVQFAIGDEAFETLSRPLRIDVGNHRYSVIKLRNAGAAPATIGGYASDTPVDGVSDDVAVWMAAISQELSGAAADPVTGQLADTICAVTPGPGTLLFAANADRTEIEIQADFANGAEVIYLGITAARSSAVDKFRILAAGDLWWSDREKGPIYACSSAGTGVAYGKEC
jgi:hypothetical protein